MPAWEDRQRTMEFRWVAFKVKSGPQPFDLKMEKRLQQKWHVTKGGDGNGVREFDEWVDVPIIVEQ